MRSIYLYIVAATLALGFLMPQKGEKRKYYIVLMMLIHIFICGFRYMHLTGDLMKYHHTFNTFGMEELFSAPVWNEGRNSGFMLFLQAVYYLTDGNFQVVLFIIAAFIHIVLGYVVYRYSPAPWMSLLVWNCLSFYLFGFSAIKQAFAMAFVMLSFIGIMQKRPGFFLGMMLLAGLIHVPSLIFLPAYWLCQGKITPNRILIYVLLGFAMFLFKDQFVNFIKSFYYDDDQIFVYSGELGSRFIMILGFALFSLVFAGYENPVLEKLTHMIIISAMLQMLAGYDNIFTRLTDYYFQFSVLYLPAVFYPDSRYKQHNALRPIIPFNTRSKHILAGIVCIFVIWFYYTYSINVNISVAVDDYTNFRFMWDVK